MSKVFISYRREDSRDAAGRISDRLMGEFGSDGVFMDVDNIPPGVDFRQHLKESVRKCDVLLAIVGESWSDLTDAHGERRLDDPEDFVRIEIELALEQKETVVIPVLMHDAKMPPANQLPGSLKQLAYRNAITVRHTAFQRDLDGLVESLRSLEKNTATAGAPMARTRATKDAATKVELTPTSKPPSTPAESPPTQQRANRKIRRTRAGDSQATPPIRPSRAMVDSRSARPIRPPPAGPPTIDARNIAPTGAKAGRPIIESVERWQLYTLIGAAVLSTIFVVALFFVWLGGNSSTGSDRQHTEAPQIP